MSSDSKKFTCKDCDYESKWRCNITRHMMRKHYKIEQPIVAPNVHAPAPNVHDLAPNVHFLENESICSEILDDTSNSINICEKCNKDFSRKNILIKHYATCKGTFNNLECIYCHNTYASRSSKSNHTRICKAKKDADMCALVVNTPDNSTYINDTTPPVVENIHNTTNNTIINNGTINNGTINNTVVQHIIVYDPKNMELLNDHISKSELKKMMTVTDRDFPRVLTDYSKALMRRSENQCVRKTNLRSSSSAVHVGDNKWEYHSDQEVLPKLLSHIATNLGNIQHDYKIKIIQELDTFIIDVQSEAVDCHEDEKEEVRLKELFKRTITNVKHLLFNLTKQTIAEKRKKVC